MMIHNFIGLLLVATTFGCIRVSDSQVKDIQAIKVTKETTAYPVSSTKYFVKPNGSMHPELATLSELDLRVEGKKTLEAGIPTTVNKKVKEIFFRGTLGERVCAETEDSHSNCTIKLYTNLNEAGAEKTLLAVIKYSQDKKEPEYSEVVPFGRISGKTIVTHLDLSVDYVVSKTSLENRENLEDHEEFVRATFDYVSPEDRLAKPDEEQE